jgi:hypothetical protein
MVVAGFALVAGCLSACASTPSVGAGGRVGLVIRHADGRTETACVAFDGDSISGEDVLSQSGLDVRLDASNAMGSLVCSIDGEGCAFPEEPCLCQCDQPGACGYWAYFGWDAELGWVYASQGARLHRLSDGDLDAWVWLTGTGPEAVRAALPQGVSFQDVCPNDS